MLVILKFKIFLLSYYGQNFYSCVCYDEPQPDTNAGQCTQSCEDGVTCGSLCNNQYVSVYYVSNCPIGKLYIFCLSF